MNNSFVIIYKNKNIADFKYPEYLGFCRKFNKNNILVVDTNCVLDLKILEPYLDIQKLIKVIRVYMDPETLIDIDIATSINNQDYKALLKVFIKFLQPIDYYEYFVHFIFPDISRIPTEKMGKYIDIRVKLGMEKVYTHEVDYILSQIENKTLIPKVIKYGIENKMGRDISFIKFILRITQQNLNVWKPRISKKELNIIEGITKKYNSNRRDIFGLFGTPIRI